MNAFKLRKGFGLIEVMAAMIILALLFTAVMTINFSNHQAALRIATRNEAVTVGQRVLDSLQVLGVSRVTAGTGVVIGDSMKTVSDRFNRRYEWTSSVTDVFSTAGPTGLEVTSLRSRKVDLEVRWILSGHENRITLSTVVE